MSALINIYPLATEKAYRLSKGNTYVFVAPVAANKQQIIEAVEKQFNVKVAGIKTLVQDGKVINFTKGKRSRGTTSRKDFKKAYVTLVEGNSIKVFDEEPVKEPVVKTEKKEKK